MWQASIDRGPGSARVQVSWGGDGWVEEAMLRDGVGVKRTSFGGASRGGRFTRMSAPLTGIYRWDVDATPNPTVVVEWTDEEGQRQQQEIALT